MNFRELIACTLHDVANLVQTPKPQRVWIDVGAHRGEVTLKAASRDPSLLVYAFEPNLDMAFGLMGKVKNFVVIPLAVSNSDGISDFHVSAVSAASSLLPFNKEGFNKWNNVEGGQMETISIRKVPTIRLDTFIALMKLSSIEYLKVDAQGSDLDVLESAGKEITRTHRIKVETITAPIPLYKGQASKNSIIEYLSSYGFKLISVEDNSAGQAEDLTFVRDKKSA